MKKQTIDVMVAFGICIYIIDVIWNFLFKMFALILIM